MSLRIAAICIKLNCQRDTETSLKSYGFLEEQSVKGKDAALNGCLMGVKTSLKSCVALYHDLHVLPSNILLVFHIYTA